MIKKDFWRGKRVLITGHTGFKGSWLSLWLHTLGAKVSGIGLEPNTDPNLFTQLNLAQKIEKHYLADIRKLESIQKIVDSIQPEIVIHLAAQPLVRQSYLDPLGTWSTNVQGSLNTLEALKSLKHHCAVVMVTTDKVYQNQEWIYGYRENDQLGGHDPYSASKAAVELAIASWRRSFCGRSAHQTRFLAIATARAGNVIGGGDWAQDRIVPDAVKALRSSQPIEVRNPNATRPWQHVLEPLGGYLCLAEKLYEISGQDTEANPLCSSFNFGPEINSNKSVCELVEECLKHWDGEWISKANKESPHEAMQLHLQIDKARRVLGWKPCWNFEVTVKKTISWYKSIKDKSQAVQNCISDIKAYENAHET